MVQAQDPRQGLRSHGRLPEPADRKDASADRQLAASINSGDEAAFERFVASHHARVARLAGRFFRSRPDVEEIVQDVFVKSYFGMGTYRGEMPLEHWLSRVTVNACYDRLRAAKRRREVSLEPYLAPTVALPPSLRAGEAEDPEAHREREEAAEAAHRLLERLSPPERLVLTLMVLEERSVREVAALTGWSTANVKIRAFRARQKMRRLLDAEPTRH